MVLGIIAFINGHGITSPASELEDDTENQKKKGTRRQTCVTTQLKPIRLISYSNQKPILRLPMIFGRARWAYMLKVKWLLIKTNMFAT
jgi:hypothetical protein